jgi:oligogalacturonide lyase
LSITLTRRAWLLGLSASAARAADLAKGQIAPPEALRFPDSATELEVVRLTNPAYTALLPAPQLRSISRHLGFFIYSSDRSGSMQVWRMELKTGESRLLTNAESLDPASVAMSPDERSCYYFDGGSLRRSYFANLRESEAFALPSGVRRAGGFAVTDDGQYAAFGLESGGSTRLVLLSTIRKTMTTLLEQRAAIGDPLFRPHRAQVLYRRDGGLWLVDFTGQNNRRLKTAEGGELGPARWAPNGRSIFYLHFPGGRELNTLRELTPDENSDKLVSKTSQFVQFGINGDASVFIGASRNPASPYVLLLLKINRRELSLCEHQSKDPAAVNPMFSPDSQRIFFQSDRDGKPAIYRIRVEKFVEETDG